MKKRDKVIVALLVVLIVALFVGGQYKSNRDEFTKERWENYQGNSRQIILKDFVDRTNVAGLTKDEIVEMLGAADDEAETFMVYFLGVPRGLFGTKPGGEDEFLYFHFEDGKVSQLEKVVAVGLPRESIYCTLGDIPDDGKFYPAGSEGGEAK